MATLPTFEIEADVAAVFLSYFQRAPEFEAMEWYAQLYIDLLEAQGDDPAAEQNAFKALSAQIYADGVGAGEVPAGPTVTNEWYVNYLYSNVLGRDPDEEGLAYWTGELDAGNIDRAELVGILIAAAQGNERDAAYVDNRTFVAVEFAQWENSNPQILDGLKYNAAEVLIGVNEDFDTVIAAQEKLNSNTGQIGETFQLTPGIDTFEGTVLDDTFNAFYEGEGASTLTNFDTIDGDEGWDVLNIYTDGTANASVPGNASIMNIEEVNIFEGDIAGIVPPGHKALGDASAYQGVRELWQIGGAQNVTNLRAETVAGFEDVMLFGGEGEDWSMVDVQAASGATEANIALIGADGEDGMAFLEVGGNALDTVNVFGGLEHDDDMLFLLIEAGVDVTGVNVNTAVDTYVAINLFDDDITSFDASGSTGDVWYAVSDAVRNVTMGLGDDVIIFGDTPTLFQNIDGGDGFDVAALGASTFQTQDYDAINQMTNVEGLAFWDEDATIQLDAAQVADFGLLAFGIPDDEFEVIVAEISNLAADQMLEVAHDDVAFLGLHNAAADVFLDVQEDAWADLMIMEGGLGATGGTLTLVGEGSVDVSNVVEGGTAGKFATIDASMLGGDLEVEQMAAGFVETVLLGASGDEVTLTVGTEGTLSSSTKGATDVLLNFNSNVATDHDAILLGGEGAADLADVVEADVSSASTLNQAFAEAASGEYDGNLVFFLWSGDTYLFANTGTDAGYDNSDLTMLVTGEHDFSQEGLIVWPDM